MADVTLKPSAEGTLTSSTSTTTENPATREESGKFHVLPELTIGHSSIDNPENSCLPNYNGQYIEAGARGEYSFPSGFRVFGGLAAMFRTGNSHSIYKQDQQCPGINDEGPQTTGEGTPPSFPGADTDGDGVSDGTVDTSGNVFNRFSITPSLGGRGRVGVGYTHAFDNNVSLGADVAGMLGFGQFLGQGHTPLDQDTYGRITTPTSYIDKGVTLTLPTVGIATQDLGTFEVSGVLNFMDKEVEGVNPQTGMEVDDTNMFSWEAGLKLAWRDTEVEPERKPYVAPPPPPKPELKACEPCAEPTAEEKATTIKTWEGKLAEARADEEFNQGFKQLFPKMDVEKLEVRYVPSPVYKGSSGHEVQESPNTTDIILQPAVGRVNPETGNFESIWDIFGIGADKSTRPSTPEELFAKIKQHMQTQQVADPVAAIEAKLTSSAFEFVTGKPYGSHKNTGKIDPTLINLIEAYADSGKPSAFWKFLQDKGIFEDLDGAMKTAQEIAQLGKHDSLKDKTLNLRGTTDSRGGLKYNQGLSELRARVIRAALKVEGYQNTGLAEGKGEDPAYARCDEKTASNLKDCQKMNRAVVAWWSKKGDNTYTPIANQTVVTEPAAPGVLKKTDPIKASEHFAIVTQEMIAAPNADCSTEPCADRVLYANFANPTDGSPSVVGAKRVMEDNPSCAITVDSPKEPEQLKDPAAVKLLNAADLGAQAAKLDAALKALPQLATLTKGAETAKQAASKAQSLQGDTAKLEEQVLTLEAQLTFKKADPKASAEQKKEFEAGLAQVNTLKTQLKELATGVNSYITGLAAIKEKAPEPASTAFEIKAVKNQEVTFEYEGPYNKKKKHFIVLSFQGDFPEDGIRVSRKKQDEVTQDDAAKTITFPFSGIENGLTYDVFVGKGRSQKKLGTVDLKIKTVDGKKKPFVSFIPAAPIKEEKAEAVQVAPADIPAVTNSANASTEGKKEGAAPRRRR